MPEVSITINDDRGLLPPPYVSPINVENINDEAVEFNLVVNISTPFNVLLYAPEVVGKFDEPDFPVNITFL